MIESYVKIAPSILSANFSQLGEEIQAVTTAGADLIHIDVMDGHFVPNLTLGPAVVRSIRHCTKIPFDVHLMVENPNLFIEPFVKAGADMLTVHVEVPRVLDHLTQIKLLGKKVGLSLSPNTPAKALEPYLPHLDHLLVMTVHPGFGGQSFLETQIPKIKEIRHMIEGRSISIEVDGGINPETAPHVIEAGATILVAGHSIFTGDTAQYKTNIENLRRKKET
jgi:ribulose-phosphate 3-epimerase